MTSIRSRWAVTRPDINGEAQEPEEWDDAELLEFEHGKLYFKNDAENLYMLFDVLEDTIEDDIRAKEYLWIVVDADRSKNITPGTDLYFRFPGSGGRFEKAYWIEPTAPSHRWAWSDPVSEAAQTFDLSFNPSFPRHRICEVALNLEEIGADPTTWWGSADRPPVVRLGLRIHSVEPPFEESIPQDLKISASMSFADLLEISLATQPEFPAADIGPVFFGVGLIPYGRIDWDTGRASTEDTAPLPVDNWAFGGRLDVLGNIRKLWKAGVRRYKITYSQDGGAQQDLRQTWSNYKRERVAGVWEDVLYSIGPDADGIYDLPNPKDDWLTANLLLRWQTHGFGGGNGLYTVRIELLDAQDNVVELRNVEKEDCLLNLAIDNTQPTVDIDNMQHAGRDIGPCEIVTQASPPDGFRFYITVNDPEGHLRWYRLRAHYGDPHEPGVTIAEETYDSAVHGPSWNGVSEHEVPAGPEDWRASESCAYGFHLAADARITNGYSRRVYPYAWCSKYVTILVS